MHWVKSWYARALAFLMASATGVPGAGGQPQDADAAAWEEARRADTYESYQNYLEMFPVGRFASEAFQRMIEESIDADLGGSPGLDATRMY